MSISQRFESSFDEPKAQAYANDYLAEVRTNWRDAEKDLRRNFAVVALLAFVFELTARGGIAEVSVGFAKINDSDLIRAGTPLLAAYLVTVIATLFAETMFLAQTHGTVMKLVYKTLYEEDLESPLYPANSAIYSQFRISVHLGDSRTKTFLIVSAAVKITLLVGSPIAFVVYAYVRLFSELGFRNILLWFSFGIAVLLLLNAISILIGLLLVRTYKKDAFVSTRRASVEDAVEGEGKAEG